MHHTYVNTNGTVKNHGLSIIIAVYALKPNSHIATIAKIVVGYGFVTSKSPIAITLLNIVSVQIVPYAPSITITDIIGCMSKMAAPTFVYARNINSFDSSVSAKKKTTSPAMVPSTFLIISSPSKTTNNIYINNLYHWGLPQNSHV